MIKSINRYTNSIYIYKVTYLILTIIILLNSQLLLLKPIFDLFFPVNTYHNKLFITILVISLFFLYLFIWLLNKKYELSVFDFSILLFVFMTILILLFQVFTSNESIISLIGNAYYNFIVLLYFPLKEYLNSSKRFIRIARMIVGIGFLYTLMTILAYFIFKYTNIAIVQGVSLIQYVNGNLRFPQTADIIGLTSILSICQMIYEKKIYKKNFPIYIVIFIICLLTLVFISIVRMMFVTVLITFLIIIYSWISKKSKKTMRISLMCFIIPIIIIVIQKLNIFDLLLGKGQQFDSAMYRFQIIDHFSKHMFDNGFFGFGFSQTLIMKYSITDIGFLGFIFKYGLIGISWLLFIVKLIIWKMKNSIEKTYSLGIITFISISFISLSMFDSQRITFLPFLFAFLDFFTRSKEQ